MTGAKTTMQSAPGETVGCLANVGQHVAHMDNSKKGKVVSGLWRLALATALAAPLFSWVAHAADICTALAIRDVPALEDSTSILKRGELDTAITQYRVNKRTGETSFCSHGGYCYPTRVQVGGNLFEALSVRPETKRVF